MSKTMIEMSLHLSLETNERLEELADQNKITKSELLKKALALIEIALKSKNKGKHLFVVNEDGEKESEIIGL